MKIRNVFIVSLLVVVVFLAFSFPNRKAKSSYELQQSRINMAATSAPAIGTMAAEQGTGIQFHQLVWTVTGSVTGCTVTLDSSPDGSTWTVGGTISSQTCTANGSSTIVSQIDNNVRPNVTAVTGGGTVQVVYLGWTTSPGMGGPGTSTNNDIATFNGTTGATMQDSGCSIVSGTLTCPIIQQTTDNSTTVNSTTVNASVFNGGTFSGNFKTAANCAQNSASPAACGVASAGVIAIPTLSISYTVNTTAVTANSRIFVQSITDNTGIPSSPGCSGLALSSFFGVSSRVAGTSFTLTLPSTVGTSCVEYWIVN